MLPLFLALAALTGVEPTSPGGYDEAPRRKAVRIAVQDLQVSEVDPRVAAVVTDSLLQELRKLQGVSVIGMDEIRAMLDQEATRSMAGCDDESCLADLAGALGAEILIVGSMAKVGDEHVFGLRRIEQAEARVSGSVSRRLEAVDGEEFLAIIGPAVEELFPDYALRAGKTRGVDEEVALKLNPPPLAPVAFWSVVGTSGGAAALATALFTVHVFAVAYYRLVTLPSLTNAGGSFAAVGAQQMAINVFLVAAAVSAVGALALGGAAAALFPLTDFAGYGDLAEEAP